MKTVLFLKHFCRYCMCMLLYCMCMLILVFKLLWCGCIWFLVLLLPGGELCCAWHSPAGSMWCKRAPVAMVASTHSGSWIFENRAPFKLVEVEEKELKTTINRVLFFHRELTEQFLCF